MKKWIIIITSIFLLTILTAGFWAYTAIFYTTPLTQQELNDLTPDWTKATNGNWSPWHTDPADPTATKTWNPAASFNAWLATIPDEDKAWPVLIESYYAYSELLDRKETRSVPGSLEWDQLQIKLETKEINDLVRRIADAFRKPYLGEGFSNSTSDREHVLLLARNQDDPFWNPNPNPNPSLLDRSGLYMHKHLDMVYLVSAYAKLELLRENPDSFVSLIESVVLSGRLVSEYLKPIDYTMRTIVVEHGYETVSWALEHHAEQFSEQQLTQLDSIIENTDSPYDLFTGPLLTYHDMVRRMIGRDGKLSIAIGELVFEGTSKPSSVLDANLDRSIQRLLFEVSHYHNLAQNALGPKQGTDTKSILKVFESRKHLVGIEIELLLEGGTYGVDSAVKRRNQLSVLATELRFAIATQRHTLRHGSPPTSQSNIDPDLMPD